MRLKTPFSYCAFFLLSVFCLSCGGTGRDNEKRVENEREDGSMFVIATLPTLDCMPLYLAHEKGLLREAGIPVKLREYAAQMDCDTAMLRGRVHGAVTDLVRAERMRKENMSLEYFTSTNLSWKLYSNKTARIKTVGQLSEKMVGMTRFSGTDYWTDVAIKAEKLKNEVFRIQLNDLNVRFKMLKNNEIDAVWLPEPYATAARVGRHRLVYDTEKKRPALGVVAFNKRERAKRLSRRQFEQLTGVYDRMCDSLNRNGVKRYREVLTKYYRLDNNTIEALPEVRFGHVTQPRTQDVNTARNFRTEQTDGQYHY